MSFVVRSSTDASSMGAAIKSEVQKIEKVLPLEETKTMQELLAESNSGRRFNMLLLSLFAGVALLMAIVGIYGVMSYTVAQRTKEIGIRVAIGAQAGDVFRMVIGQGMLLALIGIIVGLVAAFAVTRVMASMLFGVEATDPTTFIGIALLLAVVALFACYIPGRRAMRVDPLIALRYE